MSSRTGVRPSGVSIRTEKHRQEGKMFSNNNNPERQRKTLKKKSVKFMMNLLKKEGFEICIWYDYANFGLVRYAGHNCTFSDDFSKIDGLHIRSFCKMIIEEDNKWENYDNDNI